MAGPIIDTLGRRAACLSVVVSFALVRYPLALEVHYHQPLLGSAVISSSNEKGQFIAGRFILGFGVSIAASAAPAYIVEVSPPQWRGRLTGLYNAG